MKEVVVHLTVEDEDQDEMFEWAERLLLKEHPWLPGVFFAHVKDVKVEKGEYT